ncbi:MAG: hypothetical protein ABJI42_02035 [Henriciella sp.]
MPDLRVAAALSLMASACASGPQFDDEAPRFACGSDASGWILSDAPDNADEYRRLAAENPPFGTDKISGDEWGHHDRETWMAKPSGEVILCLADGVPWEAWSTSFWHFGARDNETGRLTVADQGATIIVG